MKETEGMRDSQLATALEKFILERWRHCGTIVARTTTAEQALRAIAAAGGGSHQHQHQQGGGKSAYPNSRRKNKQPFKKTGGGGPPNQVPAGQAAQGAQPGGGQQAAVVAAGAAASKQQGAANNQNRPQNQQQKWQPASAAPAAGGHMAAQTAGFRCRAPGCTNQDRHYLPECLIFRSMTVNDRWSLVSTNNFCELCLKHFKSSAFPCKLEKAAGGPPPCGEGGCTQFHHPDLHMQQAGWASMHGAVFTIAKEDSKEYNLLAFNDFSREPVGGEIKQGTGDLRACGPSTFI
jgi:hypothetical protein